MFILILYWKPAAKPHHTGFSTYFSFVHGLLLHSERPEFHNWLVHKTMGNHLPNKLPFLGASRNSDLEPRSAKLGIPLSCEDRGCTIDDCAERGVTLVSRQQMKCYGPQNSPVCHNFLQYRSSIIDSWFTWWSFFGHASNYKMVGTSGPRSSWMSWQLMYKRLARQRVRSLLLWLSFSGNSLLLGKNKCATWNWDEWILIYINWILWTWQGGSKFLASVSLLDGRFMRLCRLCHY